MRLLAYGDRAVLVELGSTDEALAYAVALQSHPPELTGRRLVETVVPAATTVLAVAADGVALGDLRAALGRVEPAPLDVGAEAGGDTGADEGDVVEVPVTYDGEDLEDVAGLTGLTVEEVVAAHTGQTWRVAFGGFAPGFGYLAAEDDRLHVPRREESRTRVPAGAVGLAGEYSGVYPRVSPGGWQLIGRTEAAMWDLQRDPPALLAPGVRVRFVEVGR